MLVLGPSSSAPQAIPRGMMLPNGQPPRPGDPFVPMQRPPFPAQMSGPPQPPVNGMHMAPMIGQQRPPSQSFPAQGFGPPQSNGPPPPKLPVNSLQSNFPPQRIPGIQQQGQVFQPGFGPPNYQNGLQASGPPTPAHTHQQFPRPPVGAFNSFTSNPPTSAAQGPLTQGPHSLGTITPNRGSPLPHTASAGATTPRGKSSSILIHKNSICVLT